MDGEFDSAMAQYRQAKEIDPRAENPHLKLGRDYYYEGMFEQAASEFGLAMHEEPDEPAPYFYLLDSLYGERRDRSILFWKSLPIHAEEDER